MQINDHLIHFLLRVSLNFEQRHTYNFLHLNLFSFFNHFIFWFMGFFLLSCFDYVLDFCCCFISLLFKILCFGFLQLHFKSIILNLQFVIQAIPSIVLWTRSTIDLCQVFTQMSDVRDTLPSCLKNRTYRNLDYNKVGTPAQQNDSLADNFYLPIRTWFH